MSVKQASTSEEFPSLDFLILVSCFHDFAFIAQCNKFINICFPFVGWYFKVSIYISFLMPLAADKVITVNIFVCCWYYKFNIFLVVKHRIENVHFCSVLLIFPIYGLYIAVNIFMVPSWHIQFPFFLDLSVANECFYSLLLPVFMFIRYLLWTFFMIFVSATNLRIFPSFLGSLK